MQRKLLILVAAALVVPLAPAALAEHGQIEDGRLYSYPFQASQDTYLAFDWFGIGGPGGENVNAVAGPVSAWASDENLGPTPDDCFDSDTYGYENLFAKVALPSVAVQTPVERTQLLPGQSAAAPAEVTLACTLARELLFGQEAGHAYNNDPQMIGFGDLEVQVEAVVTQAGFFDDEETGLVAVPTTLSILFCSAVFADTASTGDETWAGLGFPNGELSISGTPTCEDLTSDYLGFLQDNPDEQWDAGTFNRIGGGNVYRQSVSDEGDGLKIACVQLSILDANGAAAGFFEDYSYYFIDNVDANVVTDFWTSPIEHSDGGSPAQDCSSVGIAV